MNEKRLTKSWDNIYDLHKEEKRKTRRWHELSKVEFAPVVRYFETPQEMLSQPNITTKDFDLGAKSQSDAGVDVLDASGSKLVLEAIQPSSAGEKTKAKKFPNLNYFKKMISSKQNKKPRSKFKGYLDEEGKTTHNEAEETAETEEKDRKPEKKSPTSKSLKKTRNPESSPEKYIQSCFYYLSDEGGESSDSSDSESSKENDSDRSTMKTKAMSLFDLTSVERGNEPLSLPDLHEDEISINSVELRNHRSPGLKKFFWLPWQKHKKK